MNALKSSLNVNEDGSLICTIYISQYLYSFQVMKLRGNEFNLNGGRFRTFRLATQTHRTVVVSRTWRCYDWSIEIIEWIAANIDTAWSMKAVASKNKEAISPSPVLDMALPNLEFSFADPVDAVHFALRWR